MPRNMSFYMTTPQFRAKTKTVTRRQGWWHAKPGDVYRGVKKGQGLKAGEKIERLHMIEVVSARAEPVEAITPDDVIKEGFPDWTTGQFIDFYCKAHKITPATDCNRIEFFYIDLHRPSCTEPDELIKQCRQCLKGLDDCTILARGLLHNFDDGQYPHELRIIDHRPACTAFNPATPQRMLELPLRGMINA